MSTATYLKLIRRDLSAIQQTANLLRDAPMKEGERAEVTKKVCDSVSLLTMWVNEALRVETQIEGAVSLEEALLGRKQ